MKPSQLLVVALYVQGLLGLTRFALPFFGLSLDPRIWLIHPLNGAAIALAALVLFRPRRGVASDRVRLVARFTPLVALALGLGLASVRDLLGPLFGTLLHMLVGFAAIELVGRALDKGGAADAGIHAPVSGPGEIA